MLLGAVLLVVLLLVLVVLLQMRSALGARVGTALAALAVVFLGSGWGALEWVRRQEAPPPEDMTALSPVTSETCVKCHESHHASWRRTFHRTMTREPTPENIKADFNDAELHYGGITSRMGRLGDRFFLDTVDPEWDAARVRQGIPIEKAGPMQRRVFTVDRLVGSHWFQQLMHGDDEGRYLRLPLVYHIVEKRWIHINGVFLTPNSPLFFRASRVWNETCIYCHNTRPSKNPRSLPGQPHGFRTELAEMGIACEACHGAGQRHVRAHQNPARRLAQHYSDEPDPTIVNPARLSVARSDEICAHCHGGPLPRLAAWNRSTFADPYLPGQELNRTWSLSFSDEGALAQAEREGITLPIKLTGGLLSSRYWGDGTPLTTALEYQGMALSACYQDGKGEMRCLTCHSMHQSDPNHQVKDGMRSNAACYGCHDSYRERLAEHTHHTADSPGSLCANCHMPHQVYSLLDTHRSHRIAIPRVRDSLGTGKPHACNLCHLDKSLGWTSDQLHKWYGTKPEPLSNDERTLASSLLHLMRSDARSRAVVAGAFSSPDAQRASGRDWPGLLLTRALEHERYEAIRYLLHRGLRSLHGPKANDYNYQGSPAERAAQLRRLRLMVEGAAQPDRGRYPYLPLTAAGLFADDALDRLLQTRNDPDVTISE